MRFKINWRFLLAFIAGMTACLLAIFVVHRIQVGRQVGVFLHQADIARDATPPDVEREITYLRRYLMARPAETDIRERLAKLMCQTAKRGNEILEAYLIVEDTLRRDPERDELRRFAIDFAMKPQLGMYPEALSNIDALLAKRPNDGELEALKAKCLVQAKKYKEADEWYQRAIEHRPDLAETYPGWAAVLRLELKRTEDADNVVAAMLQTNEKNFRAHLLVAEYWRTFWELSRNASTAAPAVAKAQKLPPDEKVSGAIARATAEAQKLAPDELDVVLAVSNVSRIRSYELARAGKPDEAKAAFAEAYRALKAGCEKHPKAPAIYLATAALESEVRQEKEPVAVIREGLEAAPEDAALMIALLDYQIRAGDAGGASLTLDQLKKRGLGAAEAELQQGRILMLRAEWLEASLALDHVRRTSLDNPALARQANLFLGRCYEQLGLLDRRLDASRQAVPGDTTDVLWAPAMLGVAEAEAALGKADESLAAYARLRDRGYGGAWLPIARIQLIKALQTPVEKRDWTATDEALGMAEKALPKDVEVRILRANLFSLRDNPTETRKRLDALQAEHPKDVAVRIALAVQDQRDGDPRRAIATLDTAEKELGDSPAIRLAKARLWVDTKAPELDRKLKGLADDTDKFTPTQQRVLFRGLAELAVAFAPGPLGTQLWDRVSALQPHDLGAHLIRFDQALRAGDEERLDAIQKEIRRIDGDTGSSARLARAIYLIWRAQNKNERSGLDEAAPLLDVLERERAGWARVAFARALVYDLKGDLRSALDKYQKAVDQGETNPGALRRLMELLRAAGKFDEAASVLQKLPKATIADSEVQRIAAEVSLRTNNPSQAETYADKAVSDKTTDPAEYIWQGQVYYSVGAKAKAETAFRRATALKPELPDGWLVLIQLLSLTNRREEGEKALEEAKEKVTKPERPLFLGSAYAILGKADKAAEAFKQARAERPNDLRTVRTEAEFLFQTGQLAEAREAFARVIGLQSASPEDKEFARNMLGVCLAADRDYTTSRRALEELGLLEGDRLRAPTGTETPAQRRSRIVILSLQRDRASRLEAIRLLEADPEITPNDQFLLAQLHQAVGNRSQVRVVMARLLDKNGRVPLYVRFYAAWLLRTGDPKEAEKWVKRLTEIQPDALPTAELQARLAAAKGNLVSSKDKTPSARDILVPRVDTKDATDASVLAIARVCESIKLDADAETLYKRVVAKVQEKQPQAPLLLAGFYGRRGRTAEALRICDEVRTKVSPAVAGGAAVEALYETPTPKAADVAHVAEWLDEAAKKASGEAKAALVQLLASVRNLQGDYAAAMGLYRDALTANPRDVLAMNNLAFLVSAKEGKHDEALQLLARAKQVAGPLPELRDTEGLVRLNAKDLDKARELFETVAAEAPSGTAFFHLAQAELAAGRKVEAHRAWTQAKDQGLKLADLHPLERPEFERVSTRFK